MTDAYRPTVYLKEGCPFSFKLMLFMTEAGLLDRIRIVRCDPDDPDYERVKKKLADATGAKAMFPTVEIEPGRYMSDSDRLISYFSDKHKVPATNMLPAFSFYQETILPQLLELHGH